METKEIILMLRKQHKISQKKLADSLGIDRSTVGKWESGFSKPTRHLPALAKLFNVTPGFILGDIEDKTENYLPEEIKLINMFRQLNQEGQAQILDTMYSYLCNPKFEKGQNLKKAE